MKKTVTSRNSVIDRHSRYTLAEMQAKLTDAITELPPEVDRSTVTFEIDNETYAYDDGEYPMLFMNFNRLETDEEEQKRETQEAHYKAQREAADRAAYERLKKQFENK